MTLPPPFKSSSSSSSSPSPSALSSSPLSSPSDRFQRYKLIASAMMGNGLEFYDFALFGVFSVHFASIFFPPGDTTTLLKTLSIYAVGFFSRPLGSLFFGRLGDLYGRKKALALSITLMGFATFGIGCLPTYQQAGVTAPLLLLALRLLQGFCLGGENNGSAIFLLEHLKKKRGLSGGLLITGGAMGTLLATFLGAVFVTTENGWRIPFLLGIGISLAGLYIRRSLDETPEFKTLQTLQPSHRPHSPLSVLFREHTPALCCAVVVGGLNGVFAHTLVAYINIYLNQVVHFSLSHALFQSCIGITLFGCFAPLCGALGDKIGAGRLMKGTAFVIALGGLVVFRLLLEASFPLFMTAIVLFALLVAGFNGPTNAFLNTLFPPQVRYTGIAFGYAVGAAIFGGTCLPVYTYLLDVTQQPLAPAFYLGGMALLGGLILRWYNRHNPVAFFKT